MGSFISKAKNSEANHEPDLFILVGLGNPGPRYANTRHNVGFMVIDALAESMGLKTDKLQSNCAVARGRILDHKVLLVKPMTFMNVSGEGVIKLSKYYGISPDKILVIYDDLDTPTASVRLRAKGGHGGHNGMRSIIQHLHTNDFPRLKIGIHRPPEGVSVATYVLQNFSKEEREKIDVAVHRDSPEIIRAVLSLGMEKASSGMRVDESGSIIPQKNNNNNNGGGGGGKKERKEKQQKQQKQQKQSGTDEQQVVVTNKDSNTNNEQVVVVAEEVVAQ